MRVVIHVHKELFDARAASKRALARVEVLAEQRELRPRCFAVAICALRSAADVVAIADARDWRWYETLRRVRLASKPVEPWNEAAS